ncbi:MAG TPA: hypothetical protein VHN36_17640, partial [Ilumatobacteraceae bacterium]|nr:hypothetical protein [Ilumatobacteraceae bacterium]
PGAPVEVAAGQEAPDPEVVEAPAVVVEPPAIEVSSEVVADVTSDDEVLDEPVAPATPSSEINRLASVPDLIVDDEPIELPRINSASGSIIQAGPVFTPILPETVFAPVPRAATTTVATLVAESNTAHHRSRRKSKHRLRRFMSFVVLLGLLGGGAYAAKKYLLHKNLPKWSVELEPFATDVTTGRGLEFKSTVEVTPLPVTDYANRLAASVITVQPSRAEAWRALGLLNGELDLEAIGLQAMNDSPAFYDPATKTIYVSDDLKPYEHLYRFALHRALASALLDQQFDWSSRLATATPAAALALRATVDGDALAVANSLAEHDAPDQLAPELFTFVQGHASAVAPSQFAAAIVGRAGVSMRPTIAAMPTVPDARSALELSTPASDAVLNVARPQTSEVPTANSQGLMFWYYVLASRIDDTQAWSAAVHWASDSLTGSTGSGTQCFDATVGAADTDGAALLLTAFQSWAAAAPAESTTSVAAGDDNQITIRACDPGAAVTAQLPPKVPVVFGGAGVERALAQAAIRAAVATKVDVACLITAARQRGTALTATSDDAPVLAIDWQPAYVTANLDLAAGCPAAPG